MQRKLLEKLCCPFDRSDLQVSIFNEDDQHEIYEGLLTCSNCNRYFPIIHGIPIMTPDEYRQKSLEAPVIERWGFEIAPGEKTFILEQTKTSRKIGT